VGNTAMYTRLSGPSQSRGNAHMSEDPRTPPPGPTGVQELDELQRGPGRAAEHGDAGAGGSGLCGNRGGARSLFLIPESGPAPCGSRMNLRKRRSSGSGDPATSTVPLDPQAVQ